MNQVRVRGNIPGSVRTFSIELTSGSPSAISAHRVLVNQLQPREVLVLDQVVVRPQETAEFNFKCDSHFNDMLQSVTDIATPCSSLVTS
jgi:hypothetical protein